MDGEIYHHGILGQKWGVRRFQNKDGSLTAAGKQRQKKESGSNKLSNEELQKRISRLQMEETYSQLLARQKERSRSRVGKFLGEKFGSFLSQSADAVIRTFITGFDINFNLHQSLLETRLSGALTRIASAICLEEDVTEDKTATPPGGDGSGT